MAKRHTQTPLLRAGVPLLAVLLAFLLTACVNRERVSSNVTTLNREVAGFEDQLLLLNIVRRSGGEPMHFIAVPIIRDRSTTNIGANLNIPFGAAAPERFQINPSISLDERLQLEVSPQSNQEFYKGILTPVTVSTMSYYLGQDLPREVVLSLMIDTIRLRTAEGDHLYRNDPEDSDAFADFQALIARLVRHGLSIEQIDVVSDIGPPIEQSKAPAISDILSLNKEGLTIEEVKDPDSRGPERRFQMRKVVAGARFCFLAAKAPLFWEARCSPETSAEPPEFKLNHPGLFSNMDGRIAVFDAGPKGRIEIHTRSLSEMFDYLGELVRVQQVPGSAPVLQTADAPFSLFVVRSGLGPNPSPGIVSVEHGGRWYSVPAGAEGGWSGEVLSIMTELLAQAQSVADLPFSNRLTIISD